MRLVEASSTSWGSQVRVPHRPSFIQAVPAAFRSEVHTAGVHLAYTASGRIRRMSIRERPDRTLPFEVRWRDEGRHRSRAFATEKEAIRWEGKVAERLAMGAHAPEEPSRMRLDEWRVRWLDVYGPRWAERTILMRADLVERHITPHLGGVRLRDLGRQRVASWQRDLLARGASAATVNAVTRVLSACLKDAAAEGLIPANPCKGLRPLEQPPVDRRAIPLDVVARLVDAMPMTRDRLIAGLLCYAGLRPSEIRALRWADLDGGVVSVTRAAGLRTIKRTKTGGVRAVPIRAELARLIELHRFEALGGGDDLVAPGLRGGLVDWHNWSARVWGSARRHVGVDYVPYEGRHTYASLLIDEGWSIVQIAAWLGHANPTTTLRHYSHLFSHREAQHAPSPSSVVRARGDRPGTSGT